MSLAAFFLTTIASGSAVSLTDLAQDPSVVAAPGSLTRTANNVAIADGSSTSNATWNTLRAPANGSFYVQAAVTPGASGAGLSGQLLLDATGTATPISTTAKFGIFMAPNGLRTVLAGATSFNNVAQTTANRMRLRGDVDTDAVHRIFYEYSTDGGTTWSLIRKEPSGGVDLFVKVILTSANYPAINDIKTSGLGV